MASSLHPANRPRPGDAERRHYARKSVSLPISATLFGDEIKILCSNLSVGGARCHSESPIPVMTRLDVALSLPLEEGAAARADARAAAPQPAAVAGESGRGRGTELDGVSAEATLGAGAIEELHLHAVVVRCEKDPTSASRWNLALFFVETESSPLERLSRFLHEHHDSA